MPAELYGEFDGRVALVTGASQGIGRACAQAFGAMGAKVVAVARSRDGLEETCAMIRADGGEAIPAPADMRKLDQCKDAVANAVATFGGLDYAINNAGVTMGPQSFVDLSEEEWDRQMDTNLKGVWAMMKFEIPAMLERGGGAIVNTSSISSLGAGAMYGAYGVSKSALNHLTRITAKEVAAKGIRINATCPGVVDTPMAEFMGEKMTEILVKMTPIGRISQPEEIADLVLWLCSDKAALVTGQIIAVDGGFSL